MEFTHYYGRHKHQNKTVAQPSVAHKTLRARLSGILLDKFLNQLKYSDQNESELIRTLVDEAINERERKSWEKECKEMFGEI